MSCVLKLFATYDWVDVRKGLPLATVYHAQSETAHATVRAFHLTNGQFSWYSFCEDKEPTWSQSVAQGSDGGSYRIVGRTSLTVRVSVQSQSSKSSPLKSMRQASFCFINIHCSSEREPQLGNLDTILIIIMTISKKKQVLPPWQSLQDLKLERTFWERRSGWTGQRL